MDPTKTTEDAGDAPDQANPDLTTDQTPVALDHATSTAPPPYEEPDDQTPPVKEPDAPQPEVREPGIDEPDDDAGETSEMDAANAGAIGGRVPQPGPGRRLCRPRPDTGGRPGRHRLGL